VSRLHVLLYGLGPIGLGIGEILVARGYEIAGAVDIDPHKTGLPVAEFLTGAPSQVVISPSAETLSAADVDLVIHSTQSHLRQVRGQLLPLLNAGWDVISTCEELAYPWYHHPDDAGLLDRLAMERGVRLLGTGVNPGFVMDLLPLVLTAPCREVTRVAVTRVADAAQRRLPLQRKVGAGLSPEDFAAGVSGGRIAHVGLPQSVAMIAAGLGWRLAEIQETIEPVIGSEGLVRGLHQVCTGRIDAEPEAIRLDLTIAVGAEDPRDEVRIEGRPPLQATIVGGVQGDQATCAIVANAIPKLLAAPPGLRVASELPAHAPSGRPG
jgi:4-hydroxy-tetrahydrodipicolinate reductase